MIIGGIAMAVPSADATAAPAAPGMSCPKGDKLIAPTAHTTDALGVSRYTYRALPGFTTKVPASTLTASRITPAVVKDLGVPQSAKLTTAQVRSGIARESRTPAWFCLTKTRTAAIPSAGKRSGPGEMAPQGGLSGSPVVNASWAGFNVTSNEFNAPINSVEGDFPVTSAPVPAVNSQTFVWVGVGGFSPSASSLIQAGLWVITTSGKRTLSPFLEYINDSTTNWCCNLIAGSGTVNSGNELAVEVYWTSDTAACFDVIDLTTDQFPVDACETVGHGVSHDTTSAEWFMEDSLPQTVPAEEYFENLNQVPWTDVSFSEGAEANPNWHSPFAYSYNEYRIAAQKPPDVIGTCVPGSGPGGILAYPANPAGTSAAGTFDSNTNAVSGCTTG
jgi:hypothetical protein